MNSHLRPLFVATMLAAALASTSALADPIVQGPAYAPNSGLAGGATVFHPMLRITDDPTDTLDFSTVYLWSFFLDWGDSVLLFDPGGATISFGAGGATAYSGALSGVAAYLAGIGSPVTATDNLATAAADGYYALQWESDGSALLDLGSEINFTGSYTIKAGAAPQDALFGFSHAVGGTPSEILDMGFNSFTYDTVTSGQSAMKVTVNAPTPAPEPGMPLLLLAGLGAYFGAARLRRKTLN